ncbi:hypothetical protein AMAG_07105 [Allomyces macrogynus ATCC 38327]|uniref:ATP-grasp domain-containing protein n=1 Tax=Allomyces macrogynus (strain ATCC 38327) TaxID=578462 RepID=A0A0L0SH40_ALLM3|nr:hypothetical protein AMAG_07105 [Allomyces macrogynus ATCC 38327]|eukprot:KNE61828.1 hypothetical protein AMAG_07105 [Allomyces macrogynus ATCC 38327]
MTAKPNRPLNILVIDEPDVHLVTDDAGASVDHDHDMGITAFINPGVDANLFVITDHEAPLSTAAKKRTVASLEIKDPFFDGSLEMIVRDWHKKHGIDIIYCKHEEFLLRIANLRKMLGVKEGLQPENTVTFRDKVAMKKRAVASHFPVPKFQRIYSPSCLLSFIDRVGLPVIVKPTLGCASFGVRILRTIADVTKYLRTDFFAFLRTSLTSEAGQFDMAGQLIAEAYLENATMTHVNGLVDQGKLVAVWPFQCVRSYLDLAQGVAAGSLTLVPGDAEYVPIIEATTRLLKCYDLPSRFAFHLEMFRVPSVAAARHQLENAPVGAPDQSCYVLCELGARPPSASLPAMIAAHIGGSFDQLEFRFSAGLAYSLPARSAAELAASRVGDLLIPPRRHARIVYMPRAAAFPVDLKRQGVQYVPIAEDGLEYGTYTIDTKPSVARMVARGDMSVEDMTARLVEAERWFASQIVYEPLSEGKGKSKEGEKKGERMNGTSSCNGSSQH